jgi:hypothetical protein
VKPGAAQRTPERKSWASRTLLRRGQRLGSDTKIARLRIKPTARQPKVDVQGDLPLDIAFGDPRSVLLHLKALYDLNQKIGQTIALFEQFFSGPLVAHPSITLLWSMDPSQRVGPPGRETRILLPPTSTVRPARPPSLCLLKASDDLLVSWRRDPEPILAERPHLHIAARRLDP